VNLYHIFCNLRCTGRLGVVVRRRVAQDVSKVAKATGREAGGEERAKRGGEGEGSAVARVHSSVRLYRQCKRV